MAAGKAVMKLQNKNSALQNKKFLTCCFIEIFFAFFVVKKIEMQRG